MTKCDVVVIGAGAAGLSAGALLAAEGKSVTLLERSPFLGGRALAADDDGFKVNLGGHLIEDPGSGLTKVFEHVGKELIHGEVSHDMPIWDNETQTWGSIRDRYPDKAEVKKVIKAITDSTWDELEEWDDRPMREWLAQHTSDQGVYDLYEFIAVLECMTDEWYDHSASDNLWVRKMHYEERHMAAYSCWPGQGWDGMWQDLADGFTEHGGELRMQTPAGRVLIENGAVAGVSIPHEPKVPNDFDVGEVIECDAVISTLPVWNVFNVVPEWELPGWYTSQIRYLAQDQYRVTMLNLYFATEEPVTMFDSRELATWLATPHSPTPGYMYDQAAMDPNGIPDGLHLYCTGGIVPGSRGRDRRYIEDMYDRLEQGLYVMYPGLAEHVWKRRLLAFDPAFGVVRKPMLVGKFRPHWRAPTVDGLYFASETFRSRGIGTDRAARAALTCVEDILARRISAFGDGWRY